jgi:hypothetical protein
MKKASATICDTKIECLKTCRNVFGALNTDAVEETWMLAVFLFCLKIYQAVNGKIASNR